MPKLRLPRNLRGVDGELNDGQAVFDNLSEVENTCHHLNWENVVDGALSAEHFKATPEGNVPLPGHFTKRFHGMRQDAFERSDDGAVTSVPNLSYLATSAGTWVTVATIAVGPVSIEPPGTSPNNGQSRIFLIGQAHATGESGGYDTFGSPLEKEAHFLRFVHGSALGNQHTHPRPIGTASGAYTPGIIHSFIPTQTHTTVSLQFMAHHPGGSSGNLSQALSITDASVVAFEVNK